MGPCWVFVLASGRFRCGLFRVYKDSQVDRQVSNPIPENARSFSVSDATLSLGHSCLLCQVYIPPGCNLVVNSMTSKTFITISSLLIAMLRGLMCMVCFRGRCFGVGMPIESRNLSLMMYLLWVFPHLRYWNQLCSRDRSACRMPFCYNELAAPRAPSKLHTDILFP